MFRRIILISLSVMFAFITFPLTAQQSGNIETQVKQALNASYRTDNDRQADGYRLPAETLAFLGLKNDMRVMELLPGRGYYTKILGQILADNGKLYVGADGERVEPELPKWGLNNVEILNDNFATERRDNERQYSIVNDFAFDVSDLDMVLTFRNTHNFKKDDRIKVSKEVLKTLKSGGIYGVIGHTRRHMEPYDVVRWRRVDPVDLIKEMQEIGFVFKDYSTLHYREHDGLVHDTTHDSLGRDSDRFTMIFVKP
jgi:predicted methyltransferase